MPPSLSLSIYIYTYTYTYIHLSLSLYLSIYLSLSLYIYIYIEREIIVVLTCCSQAVSPRSLLSAGFAPWRSALDGLVGVVIPGSNAQCF